jgi:hypothetical protein
MMPVPAADNVAACAPLSPADAVARIAGALTEFAPITLPEMEEVKLLDRVDTKYLMTVEQLLDILAAVSSSYRVLTNCDVQASLYRTVYFETAAFNLYLDHHNDRRERYKVRARTYIDSAITFLEVKRKTKRSRTLKVRRQIAAMPSELERENLAFVREHYPGNPWLLNPVIWNTFRRITLVNKQQQERLTIDIGLQFGWGEIVGGLDGIAIIEVKQPKFSFDSPFMEQMRQRGIFRTGFSKYCAGMAYIYPHLKTNRFKRRQLLIHRLQRVRGMS